ncbi:MAG TPA: GNAT family N-acetyltransferase [Longimicrobium sp.]|jgi:ribosomal protein S18 acetylase RimI-like enzyme
MMEDVEIVARPALTDDQLNVLFEASWPGHTPRAFGPTLAQCLGHFGAFAAGRLIGFVKVAWDGGDHAFLLDPTVHPDYRRHGIGLALVRHAARMAAEAGVEWLHVDYEPHLANFYEAAGFRPTEAALLRLRD